MKLFKMLGVIGAGLAVASGCTSSMTPGKMQWVQTTSSQARAGNVYLLRGWIGIFSHGIDALGQEINQAGVRASVYQDDQWSTLADAIVEKYKHDTSAEPLILVGHSYGADDVVRVAERLQKEKINVDLLITLDPVTPPGVPRNVKFAFNIYQSNGVFDTLPVLRGIALRNADDRQGNLENNNIRKERTDLLEPGTDHFNIEKKQKIHQAVIQEILAYCPPRESWLATRRQPLPRVGQSQVQARPTALSPTTRPIVANTSVGNTANR